MGFQFLHKFPNIPVVFFNRSPGVLYKHGRKKISINNIYIKHDQVEAWIRIRMDPQSIGTLDPDPHKTGAELIYWGHSMPGLVTVT